MRRFFTSVVWLVLIALFAPTGLLAEQRLRVVAGNLTSGTKQSYDLGHGARIFQGLKPDVVLIQEFNYGNNSSTAIRGFVTATFDGSFSFYREPGLEVGGGAQIPNGVISRYPIVAAGKWEDPKSPNREFAWARINIPGPKDLWAISVHLLTTAASRPEEAAALVGWTKSLVPASDYLVIGGDFNSSSRTETALQTLNGVVGTSGPFPADQNGNELTNAARKKPFDNVFADPDLRPLQTPVIIGKKSFANGLVADMRVYTPIADVYPATASDSEDPYMQHMAIVKDFLIPVPAADPPVIPVLSAEFVFVPAARGSIRFSTTVAATYKVLASSDLAPGSWVSVGTITATATASTIRLVTGVAAVNEISDPELGFSARRFYRIERDD